MGEQCGLDGIGSVPCVRVEFCERFGCARSGGGSTVYAEFLADEGRKSGFHCKRSGFCDEQCADCWRRQGVTPNV